MRQRNGRQKFHDLRLLTFQDWILPNCSQQLIQTKGNMQNFSTIPVFNYKKMNTSPPLSTIKSQFAWAGHILPDLVQEQSDRLLRRLERPRTADSQMQNYKNSQMKGHKISRPLTAFSTPHKFKIHESTSVFKVNGKKCKSNYDSGKPSVKSNESEKEMQVNAVSTNCSSSDRSCSPDFMADLYEEYDKKLTTVDDVESYRNATDRHTPTFRLLRRPNCNVRSARTTPRATQTDIDTKMACIVKLPNQNSEGSVITTPGLESMIERIFKPKQSAGDTRKSETWLDLSQLCESSEEEELPTNKNKDSIKPADSPMVNFLGNPEHLTENEDIVDESTRPMKPKHSRPHSSKNFSKSNRPKSKRRKKRSSSAFAEESTRERKSRVSNSSPKSTSHVSNQHVKSSDKLREEIETQMSKLDMETNGLLPTPKKTVPPPLPQLKPSLLETLCACPEYVETRDSGRMPIKKVPIQILSDPFKITGRSCEKSERYDGKVESQKNGILSAIEERLNKDKLQVPNGKMFTNSRRILPGPQQQKGINQGSEVERIQHQLRSRGMWISTEKLKRSLLRPPANTYDECVKRLPASTSITMYRP